MLADWGRMLLMFVFFEVWFAYVMGSEMQVRVVTKWHNPFRNKGKTAAVEVPRLLFAQSNSSHHPKTNNLHTNFACGLERKHKAPPRGYVDKHLRYDHPQWFEIETKLPSFDDITHPHIAEIAEVWDKRTGSRSKQCSLPLKLNYVVLLPTSYKWNKSCFVFCHVEASSFPQSAGVP